LSWDVAWIPGTPKAHRTVIVPVLFPQVKHLGHPFLTFWIVLARILESAAKSISLFYVRIHKENTLATVGNAWIPIIVTTQNTYSYHHGKLGNRSLAQLSVQSAIKHFYFFSKKV